MLTGPDSCNHSRKPEIVADAAYAILIKDSKTVTGNFFIDDEVLVSEGVTNLKQYACNPGMYLRFLRIKIFKIYFILLDKKSA